MVKVQFGAALYQVFHGLHIADHQGSRVIFQPFKNLSSFISDTFIASEIPER
jgi:hypothetical protein